MTKDKRIIYVMCYVLVNKNDRLIIYFLFIYLFNYLTYLIACAESYLITCI